MKCISILMCSLVLYGCASAPSGTKDRIETIDERDMILTRFESFDEEPLSIEVSDFSDKGGAGIASTSAATSLIAEGERLCLLFKTDTTLSFADACDAGPDDWFNYYLTIDTQRSPSGYDGVALELKARHFNYLELVIKDERRDGLFLARAPVFLNENEWQQVRIPFDNFVSDEKNKAIDMRRPLVLEITIPYDQNLYLGHFEPGGAGAELLLDNLAFFRMKEPAVQKTDPAAGVIEDFEDSVADISFYGELAETVFYVDYSESDIGECRITPGVENHSLVMEKFQEQDETFFRVRGDVSITPDFAAYLDEERSFYLFVRGQIAAPEEWEGFCLSVRSDVLRECQADFIDIYTGSFYAASFPTSPVWQEVRLSTESLEGDEGTLAEAGFGSGSFMIIVSGEIPPQALRGSIESGTFTFYMDLDDIGFF